MLRFFLAVVSLIVGKSPDILGFGILTKPDFEFKNRRAAYDSQDADGCQTSGTGVWIVASSM